MMWLDDAQVAERASRLAAAWTARGVGPGDVVAVIAGNGPDFVAARDAATALGATFAPVNLRLARPEIEYAVRMCRAKLVFHEGDAVAAGAHPLRRGAGATILFTSGTTGRPKACVRPERVEAARLAEMTATYGIGGDDVHLIACPLAHSAPGAFLRVARLAGARTAILARFDAAAFVAAVAAARATFCFLVPTQIERLLALPDLDGLASLRAVIVAGAPFAPASRAKVVQRLGAGKLWEFYGSSETGTISVAPPAAQPAPAGFVGWPPPGVDVEVREPDETGAGELWVRSPARMAGYLGGPEIPPDAAITVGDIGRRSADGGVLLVDRKGDLVISGGLNVYPAEVERALLEHPAVRAAVVCGRPHPDWGEEVCALVATDEPLDAAALRAFLRDHIAAYKIPKTIRFLPMAELPFGSSGKPLRRAARALLG